MRLSHHFRSLRFRIILFSIILFAGIAGLLLYNNIAAINMLRAEICSTAKDLLTISQRRLDDFFTKGAGHLATFSYQQENVETIERGATDSTAYYVSIERLKREFTNALHSTGIDSFFYYHPARGLYFANINDISSPVRQALIAADVLTPQKFKNKWLPLQAGGNFYLVRSMLLSNSYVGAWTSVQSAIALVQGDQLAGSQVCLQDQDGAFLSANAPRVTFNPQAVAHGVGYDFMTIDGKRWLAVTQKVRFGDFYLTALIPDDTISNRLGRLSVIIAAASALAFGLFTFGLALLHRWIVRPVGQLTQAIRILQQGNFQASLPKNTYDEFQEVNQAFNTATEEIIKLKIDMYEERLLKQKIQMQYLQMQIAPHFLINCLNTVYQLTDTQQPELTRAMLRTLSEHLRYTLSTSETVSLQEELRHVENYVELSAIRYPNCVSLIADIDPETLNALVVPLMILSFVENTIKYEATIGKRLEIHISAKWQDPHARQRVHLRIWDTGSGFGPEILADLQDIHEYLEKHSDVHIGIGNVFQRAEIMFDRCDFTFSNRESAGAQIDITIPYLPFQEGGLGHDAIDR